MFSLARHRISHWREIISWPIRIALALISFCGTLAFLRDEILPVDVAAKYKVMAFFPPWPWYYWAIIALSAFVVGILEGSFHVVNAQKGEVQESGVHLTQNISLYDAARTAYEETIDSYGKIARKIERNDSESLMTWFSYALA